MKVGYIGLGNMGGGMACCLSGTPGFDVIVHDIRRDAAKPQLELGARWADNPAALARECDVVITSLPGPPVIEQVVYGANGLMGSMRQGSTFIDMSTNSPALIRKMHSDFSKQSVAVLDAPVSGLLSEAHQGKLTIYIGGDRPAPVPGCVADHSDPPFQQRVPGSLRRDQLKRGRACSDKRATSRVAASHSASNCRLPLAYSSRKWSVHLSG